jgi:hypothetical protein
LELSGQAGTGFAGYSDVRSPFHVCDKSLAKASGLSRKFSGTGFRCVGAADSTRAERKNAASLKAAQFNSAKRM